MALANLVGQHIGESMTYSRKLLKRVLVAAIGSTGLVVCTESIADVISRTTSTTADDQNMRPNDVELTSRIRRELMKKESLSTFGRNVKIITENAAVTLRGPVSSAEEKLKVEQTAYDCAGKLFVTSYLELKNN
jgi:osmotically-inducible protein OsmY